MSKEDNSLIDNAVDSAYEKIGGSDEKEPTIEADTDNSPDSKEESAPIEAADKESAETAEESQDEQLTDETAIAETSDQSPSEQLAETVEAPAILSAETKALWSKVPAEVQKALAADALRTQQQLSRLANESQRAKAWENRVNSDFSTKEDLDLHRAKLRANGMQDEVAELHNYRAWSKILAADPLTAVREIIVKHGITPEELNEGPLSEDQERFINDPRIDEIVNDFRSLKEQQEQERKAREAAETATMVNNWKASTDKYGKPKADFASLYAPQIDQEFQRIISEAGQMGIQKSMPEFLDEAFYTVQDRIFKAHGINPTKPATKTPEQIAADTAKAQAAATKASGAPRTDVITKRPKKEYRNEKEWVNDIIDKAEQKISGSQRYR